MMTEQDRLISTNEVLERVGFRRTKLNEELADPDSDFPRPVLSSVERGGRRQFSNNEISQYIERRLACRSDKNQTTLKKQARDQIKRSLAKARQERRRAK